MFRSALPTVGGISSDVTDAAVDFIEKAQGDPFVLYFSYYTVHGPIMAKPELLAKYQAKAKGFDNARDENLNPAYAGMVESQSVGRVLRKIEEAGLADDTVMIFTADNGGVSPRSSGGLRGAKALGYEGGTREPTLVKWAGKVKPGTVCDTPVIGTDFYPTILEMAGVPAQPEAHVDGLSLVPLLTEKADTLGSDALFWHYPHYHRTLPEQANQRFIKLAKSFPLTKIPDNFGGGRVAKDLLGVLVAGDLIDSADKNGGYYPAMQQFEWERYKADYGLTGKDGGLPFPVYELHGNHDGPQGDTFA